MAQTRKLIPLPAELTNIVMSFFVRESDELDSDYLIGWIGLWENCTHTIDIQTTFNGIVDRGYFKLIKYFIRVRGAIITNHAIECAISNGYIKIAEYMNSVATHQLEINKVNLSLNTCGIGNTNAVKYIIKNKLLSCDDGLSGACMSGNIKMATLMMFLGAKNVNNGLECSCIWQHRELSKYMIKCGATYCVYCKKSADEHPI